MTRLDTALQLVEQVLRRLRSPVGTGQDESVLPFRVTLDDGNRLSGQPLDRQRHDTDAFLSQKPGNCLAGGPTERHQGGRRAAKTGDRARHVDPATTRIEPRRRAAQLVVRNENPGLGREIERRVQGDCENGAHGGSSVTTTLASGR
ncbi:MAG: hypothetical protein ACJASC_003394 [Limimaricola cinnabarinus]|jgi:hypothetical protein